LRKLISMSLLAAAAACAPNLQGGSTCNTNEQCQPGEFCNAFGACVPTGAVVDAGALPTAAPPAAAPPDAAIQLTAPTAGSATSGHFRVSATTNVPTNGVTFVAASPSGVTIGSLAVAGGVAGDYGGTLNLDDPAYAGTATVHAVLHQAGAADVASTKVAVLIDQTAPTISSSFDGGSVWYPRGPGIAVTATVSDDRSGVGTAQLLLPDGGAYPGDADAGIYVFQVPSEDIAPDGAEATIAFALAATDIAGNRAALPDASVFKVDGRAPSIAVAPVDPTIWHNGAFSLTASVDDGAGSGVASAGLLSGTALAAGVPGGGSVYSFATDFTESAAGFEGRLVLQVIGTDAVGNVGDAGVNVLVDTVPPTIQPVIVTTPEYVDEQGRHWFAPAQGADTIALSAVIDGGQGSPIDVASIGAVNATVDASASPVVLGASRSALGAGREGPATVQVSARDTAGNRSTATVDLFFDDVPPALAQTALLPPGWVPRTTAGAPNLFNFSLAAPDNGSGTAGVQVHGAGSGPLLASLSPAGGGAWFGLVDATFAPPGTEGPVSILVAAADQVGNRSSQSYDILIDDVPPAVSLDPADPNDSAWHSAAAGNLSFAPGLLAIDHGSGVAQVTLAGAQAVSAGAGTNLWRAASLSLPATATVETDAYLAAATARDAVGNSTSVQLSFKVDNKPPVVSAVRVDTAFDGIDANGQGWFKGPTAAPAAGSIVVSAAIDDGFLVASGAGAPSAVIGGNPIAGTLSGGRWSFSLPRSIGLNASGIVAVAFDAQDQAGNHVQAAPTLSLLFDDVPASAFAPSIASDAVWYARGVTINPSVAVTLPAVPRSGVTSVVLKAPGQGDITCSGASVSYQCTLASTAAPAGAETVLGFTVVATSAAGASSTSSGSRNFDDVPPVVVATSAIPYPPAASGPLVWSHDGAHFNLRDSGTLYTFSAYDCGAGIHGLTSFAVSPGLAGRTASVADSGSRQPCLNGTSATVFNVSVAGDLSTSSPGSFTAADNALSISVTVDDLATDTHGALVSHASSATKSGIDVTRRLWQTGALGASHLAIGPAIVVSGPLLLGGLRLSDGATLWSSSAAVGSGPVIGGSASAAVGYYGVGSNALTNQVIAFDPLTGASQASCPTQSTVGLPLNCRAPLTTTRSTNLAVTGSGAALFVGSVTATGVNSLSGDECGTEFSAFAVLGATCSSPVVATTSSIVNQVAVGRAGHAFFVSELDDIATGASTTTIAEAALTGGLITRSALDCDEMVLTDSGGSDSPACDTGRYVFGSAFAPMWNGLNAGPAITVPLIDRLIAGASGFALSSGAAAFSAPGTVLAVDASPNPIAYIGSGPTLTANPLTGAGVGGPAWGMPALPGTAISDLAMDKHGNVYVVSSSGQVSAIATDSPGLGTANSGWATRGRDACRSSSLDFTCPF
jgi:hypothetical protein